ncbi:MAG: chemotaxis protein CheW [Vulcanimicrobiota bacterium]
MTNVQMLEKQSHRGSKLNKYLTFALGHEVYALEILMVREIIGLMEITMVPRMPDFVRGVINLRGKVIPVIDLRRKFGMEDIEETKETCIIVVDINDVLMGIVVDRVSEVLDIPVEEIDETPSFGVSITTDFILGIGKVKGKVIIILDIKAVLTKEELQMMSQSF